MSNYCLYFCIKKYIDKIKIDYYNIFVEKNDNLFKSTISNEIFNIKDFKKKKGFLAFFKKKKGIVECRCIFENSPIEDLKEAEKKYIPIIQKFINRRIPLEFQLKKQLSKRVNRILEN